MFKARALRFVNIMLFVFTTFCLQGWSCGNNLYYDQKKNSVCSCGGTVYNLAIVNTSSGGDQWYIAPRQDMDIKCLPLDGSMNHNYTVMNAATHDSLLRLKPSKRYLVSYSSGDMAPGDFYLITDASGNITSATKTSCH